MSSLLVLLLHLDEIVVELIKAALPKSPLPRQPILCHLQLLWDELIRSDASRFVRANKSAVLQHLEVFYERGECHVVWGGKITYRGGVNAKPGQYISPCGIGQCPKDPINGRRRYLPS